MEPNSPAIAADRSITQTLAGARSPLSAWCRSYRQRAAPVAHVELAQSPRNPHPRRRRCRSARGIAAAPSTAARARPVDAIGPVPDSAQNKTCVIVSIRLSAGQAFPLVRNEKRPRLEARLAGSRGECQLPAQVDRILHSRVHALSTRGRVRVGGVAGEEHRPGLKACGESMLQWDSGSLPVRARRRPRQGRGRGAQSTEGRRRAGEGLSRSRGAAARAVEAAADRNRRIERLRQIDGCRWSGGRFRPGARRAAFAQRCLAQGDDESRAGNEASAIRLYGRRQRRGLSHDARADQRGPGSRLQRDRRCNLHRCRRAFRDRRGRGTRRCFLSSGFG